MLLYIILILLVLIGLLFLLFVRAILVKPPKADGGVLEYMPRRETPDGLYICESGRLRKNRVGLWELYIEGEAYRRGLITGKLTAELIAKQEQIFVEEVKNFVPSAFYLFFLKLFVVFMNRKLNRNVGEEYNLEIYGISRSASDEFSKIGPAYIRILNYHAAHDIGHTLESLKFVGCTSFAAWGDSSDDGRVVLGRNFDFYMGDEFCSEKIVSFCKPDLGYRYMSVNWGGLTGTVSGMNEHGLAVTVNGAKSEMPNKSAMPITILVKKILQYAKNINEAFEIAKAHLIFVSESILVASAQDHKAVAIEKSPSKTVMYDTGNNHIICTNHFQSEAFADDKLNNENLLESASLYRFKRMEELFEEHKPISPLSAAAILRDRFGLGGADIGQGNEKAVNQLLAHHSVIFKPEQRLVWVSSWPYNLGEFVCYDLNSVFAHFPGMTENSDIDEHEWALPPDEFCVNGGFANFERFKEICTVLKTGTAGADDKIMDELIELNPEYFHTYLVLGDFCLKIKKQEKALDYYKMALLKEIPTTKERNVILSKARKIGYKD
ncbi:MAG: C45 family peptidase [Bacteroidota bacterium]